MKLINHPKELDDLLYMCARGVKIEFFRRKTPNPWNEPLMYSHNDKIKEGWKAARLVGIYRSKFIVAHGGEDIHVKQIRLIK